MGRIGQSSLRRMALLWAFAVLSACSIPFWHTDSLNVIDVDGREVVVSKVMMSEKIMDMVAFDPPERNPALFPAPLSAETARAAAEKLAADHCQNRFASIRPAVAFSDYRYAFRYACSE